MSSLPFVLFPDVTLWLVTYLRTGLAARSRPNVRVADNYKPAAQAVQVRPDGGQRLDVVREARRFGITVWADDPTGADVNALTELTRALVYACPTGAPVVLVSALSGAFPIDDPTGQPCRYFTSELIVRGATA